MRGGQQTQGGVEVRRNIVIRGIVSLLLVIRVVVRGVIRGVLRSVVVLRWACSHASYWLNSTLPALWNFSLVVYFALSRSTGFVRARCVLEVGTSDSSPYSFSEFEESRSSRVNSGSGASS